MRVRTRRQHLLKFVMRMDAAMAHHTHASLALPALLAFPGRGVDALLVAGVGNLALCTETREHQTKKTKAFYR
jgi:hypothetical protein